MAAASPALRAAMAKRLAAPRLAAHVRPLHSQLLLALPPRRAASKLRGPELSPLGWARLRAFSAKPLGGPALTPYEVLGLPSDATTEQVKQAYYRLAMLYHPDRSSEPDAKVRFHDIGVAYKSIIGASKDGEGASDSASETIVHETAPFVPAYPSWAHRLHAYLHRIPQRFDLWLMPSYSSIIYQHLRKGELSEAFEAFDDMRVEGEKPSHAVYEMLIRGCAIAMQRPKPGQTADHLTNNLVNKVTELWNDMEAAGRKPDYLTHIELMRAFGKGGDVRQALAIFKRMCSDARLLPEQRAFDSAYELCVLSGHYKEALEVFEEHEEMRKSLWRPRYTATSFSLLLTASATLGSDVALRLHKLPRILELMGSHGILPRTQTCEHLLEACVFAGELELGRKVLELSPHAKTSINPKLVAAVAKGSQLNLSSSKTREINS